MRKGDNMSKKKNRQNRQLPQVVHHFELRQIAPLTVNQEHTFESYKSGMNLMLHGYAGTGKSFISLWLALDDILNKNVIQEKVLIIRSVVPSRDMGFLPGSMKDKQRVYEKPYQQICDDLFGRGDGYDILKMKGIVDFETTSFLRGCTMNNTIIIVDEMQNMTFQELDTVMTRVGDNSRIIFCGDFRQTDLNERDRSGLSNFINITRRMKRFSYVEFGKHDIVRSGLVKDYIIQRTELGLA
jgi:phosphate starvation-inducible protein PhoH